MKHLKFLKEHVGSSWVKVLGVLATILLLVKLHDLFAGWLGPWMHEHAKLHEDKIVIDSLVITLVAVLCLVLVIVLGLLIYALVSLYLAKRAGGKADILLKTFRRTTQAADLISRKLFPGASMPIKKVLSCKQIYTIYDNGDCQFKEILVVSARDKPIHFLEKIFDAEPEAEPAEFPDDIDLKIKPRTVGKSLVYLITKNEPRSKAVVVFFLPFIKPDGQDQRTLETAYYWKGLMKKLLGQREEPFTYQVKSVESVPEIEYQFWVKPKLGKLVCTHVGESLEEGKETLTEVPEDDKGLQGYIYRGRDIPPEHITRLRLELKST